MSSPGFIVMQANNAVTNRTFRIEGVKPPFSQQFYQLYKPYGYAHGRLASFARDRKPVVRAQLCAGIVAPETEMHRRIQCRICLGYWAGLLHSFCTEISQPGAQIRVAPPECFSHPSRGWFAGQPLQCAISWRRKVATGASSSLGKTI